MTETPSEAKARSEASGRERSIAQCGLCKYWSSGARCNRATSKNYARTTQANWHCWEFEKDERSRERR